MSQTHFWQIRAVLHLSIAGLLRPFRAGLLGGLFPMGFTHRYDISPLQGFLGEVQASQGGEALTPS